MLFLTAFRDYNRRDSIAMSIQVGGVKMTIAQEKMRSKAHEFLEVSRKL